MGARVDSRVEVARISTLGLRRAPSVANRAETGRVARSGAAGAGCRSGCPRRTGPRPMLPCATLPTRPRCPPKEPIVSASRSYGLPVTRPGPRTRGPRAGRALIRLRGIDGRLYAIVLLRWAHEAMRARARAPTARRPRSIDVPPMCAIRTPGRRLIRQGRRFPSGRGARALARSLAPASCIRRPEPSPGTPRPGPRSCNRSNDRHDRRRGRPAWLLLRRPDEKHGLLLLCAPDTLEAEHSAHARPTGKA